MISIADLGLCGLITPIDTTRLAERLRHYRDASYIVHGFTHGFSLDVAHPDMLRCSYKPRYARQELIDMLNTELDKGHLLGPFEDPPIPNLHVSPVNVVPKANGKWRLITNLSFPVGNSVNDAIPEASRSVSYCSVSDVVRVILQCQGEVFLSKIDLKNAYRMVPVSKQDWPYLGMFVNQHFIVDRCLPIAAASSCKIFQRISDSFRGILLEAISTPALSSTTWMISLSSLKVTTTV